MLRSASVFVALVLLSGVARAEGKFAGAGTVVPFGSIDFSRISIKPPEGDSQSTTSVSFLPGAMYFVMDNLAVGASLAYRHSSTDDLSSSGFGFGPVVGYNVPLVDNLTLFPQASFVYAQAKASIDTGALSLDATTTALSFVVDAPVLYHAGNFFVGFGPHFSTMLMSKVKVEGGDSEDAGTTTEFGLTSTIGGWF